MNLLEQKFATKFKPENVIRTLSKTEDLENREVITQPKDPVVVGINKHPENDDYAGEISYIEENTLRSNYNEE